MRRALLLFGFAAVTGCAGAPQKPDARTLPGVAEPSKPAAPGIFATLATDRGDMVFRLLPEAAPMAVENFVGLATGKKAWADPSSGTKTSRRLYDGTVFFRVLPGFIIQGGDPLGDGSGGPGFTFDDELRSGRSFDKAGLLAMASPGPDSNGSQFFITLGPAPWLDRKHTIFGEMVSGLPVAQAIAGSPRVREDPVSGALVDRPVGPPRLREVRIGDKP